jgi:SRSO17 transposase
MVTSSTWDYRKVRANVAQWGRSDRPARVRDRPHWLPERTARPRRARQHSGTPGKTANGQIGVSVQVVTDAASLGSNWRPYCPDSWGDATADDPDLAERSVG